MKFRVYMDEECKNCIEKFKCLTKEREKCRDLVSTHLHADPFMPGVGIIIKITKDGKYVCEHNGKRYTYKENEIYEYDPY